jgi:uncharacterized protein (TIGR00369 family)
MGQAPLTPVLDAAAVNELMQAAYPQLNAGARDYEAVEVFPGGCTVRLNATEKHLRPGNTVSGPSLFTLADIGGYVCVLSHAGPDALSVTTNLNINFMRKPDPGHLVGEGRLLKLGKTLAVGDFTIWNEGEKDPVAHATVTYSIPPKRQ